MAVVAIGLGLFVLSTMFPVVAAVMRNPAPRWVGIADVVVAFALFVQAIVITRRAPKPDADVVGASLRVVRVGANLLLGLIVVFFLAGHRIKWDVLLLGLAWRAWLFVWVLPSALTLWHNESRS